MSRMTTIPFLDLGQAYDQRYAGADFHYDAHGRLSDFFGRNVAVHRHDRFFQIHFIHNGRVHLYLDDQPYCLDGPLCFLTPPGVAHAFVTDADSEGQVITVHQARVWPLFEHEASLAVRLGHPLCAGLAGRVGLDTLPALFTLFAEEFQGQDEGRDANLQALLRLILTRLLRLEAVDGRTRVADQDLLRFHRFSLLIEQHHAEHWPLQHYADELGMTTARLNLVCRRLAGMSSRQLIADRQLQEAKRLLLHSGQSVSQIGFSLGFQDPAYFSRFFSQQVGCSPSTFREQPPAAVAALRKVQA